MTSHHVGTGRRHDPIRQPADATAVPKLAGGSRTLDFALMVFPQAEAAEHAYAHVIDRAAGEPWLNEAPRRER